MFHHHARYDRDSFISVLTQNMRPGWDRQYAKKSQSETTNLGQTYDYGSVMHYTGCEFTERRKLPDWTGVGSDEGRNIILLAKDKRHQHTMGNRYGPVFSDLLLVNKYYQCFGSIPLTMLVHDVQLSRQMRFGQLQERRIPAPEELQQLYMPEWLRRSRLQRASRKRRRRSRVLWTNGSGAHCTVRGQKLLRLYRRLPSPKHSLEAFSPDVCRVVGRKRSVEQLATSTSRCGFRVNGLMLARVQAPAGQRVEITMQRVSGTCTEECALGATEVKYEKLTLVGPQ